MQNSTFETGLSLTAIVTVLELKGKFLMLLFCVDVRFKSSYF